MGHGGTVDLRVRILGFEQELCEVDEGIGGIGRHFALKWMDLD